MQSVVEIFSCVLVPTTTQPPPPTPSWKVIPAGNTLFANILFRKQIALLLSIFWTTIESLISNSQGSGKFVRDKVKKLASR